MTDEQRMEFIPNFPIGDIVPFEGNAKQHPQWQIDQIVSSIQRNNFNDPIAIDENGVVIEGHGRLLAARQMGLTELPVIRLSDLTETQKREYILAHNKTTMNTGFDIYQLTQELDFLYGQEVDFSYLQFTEWVAPLPDDTSVNLDAIDAQASSDVGSTNEANETGSIIVKFRVPIEQKALFIDWVNTGIYGSEFEGQVTVV